MYQHDPRHVDVLVKDFGLELGNSMRTPGTHDVTKEEREPCLTKVNPASTSRKLQDAYSSVKIERT